MIKGLYTSAAGMLPLQYRQDVLANNLANSHTPGFKRDRVFVHDLVTADLYLNEHGLASTGERPAVVGVNPQAYQYAVGDSKLVVEEQTDFSQGSIEVTGNDFNLALDGNGFFAVQTPQGLRYTRAGFFGMSRTGTLATAEGYEVQGAAGPINVQGGKLMVSNNGDVLVDGELRGRIRVADFPRPYHLTKESDNLYVPEGQAAGQPAQNFAIKQGALESANGHPVDQLVRMIELQRLFELGQRAIRMQDESLQQVITQGGRL